MFALEKNRRLAFVILVLAVAGCGERAVPAASGAGDGGGGGGDLLLARDGAQPDRFGGSARDLVVNRIQLPTSAKLSARYALQYNGKKYNHLGNLLSLLITVVPNRGPQDALDEAVCSGESLLLLRLLQAKGSASSVEGKMWPSSALCCKGGAACVNKWPPVEGNACVAAAVKACFAGKATFKPTPGAAALALKGTLSGGALTLGPGRTALPLALIPGMPPLNLPLKQSRLSGKLGPDGLEGGILNGAIDQKEFEKIVLPQVAALFNKMLKDPKVDQATKQMLLTLFDINKDGVITAKELAENSLIKTFLQQNPDVDGDGKPDLTLGVGLRAVGAKIAAP